MRMKTITVSFSVVSVDDLLEAIQNAKEEGGIDIEFECYDGYLNMFYNRPMTNEEAEEEKEKKLVLEKQWIKQYEDLKKKLGYD